MGAISFIIALAVVSICKAASPQLRFAWKELNYAWDTPADRENAIKDGTYIPANNLPVGLARWKNKVFVTVTRWKPGVASALNYIDLDGPQDQPLKPYPSFKDNLVPDTAKELLSNSSIISVFRVYVDSCDRLWVMDTGLAVIFGIKNRITRPSIVIFDLNTDQLIKRYFFKNTDLKDDSFFANILSIFAMFIFIVDEDKNSCDNAFAYVPDIGAYGVVVYSLKQDDSWRVKHHYFHLDPLAGSFNVNGLTFQWSDGVFSLGLTEPHEDGYKTAFFHAFSSTKEFSVSTEILRNYRDLDKNATFHDFKLLGDRGELTQSSASVYDPKTNVLFYTQVNRNGIGCWNSNKPYTKANNPLIFSDSNLYEFPNDVKIDVDDNLWILFNRIPLFFYRTLDVNEINYSIYTINTRDAIAGTTCEQV